MLSIIIPVFNEEENIEDTFNAIKKNIPDKIRKIIYVIYDFDDDPTIPVIKRIKGNYNFPIRLIKNKFGQGAANAVKTGFGEVKSRYSIVTMADLSDDYGSVPAMLEMADMGYDIVCASRYMRGGRLIGGPVFKKILSKAAGLTLFFIKGISTHDATNNFRLYRKNILNNIQISSRHGFDIGLEILVRSQTHGFKIGEVPTIWKYRKKGKTKFNLMKSIPYYLRWYLYAIVKNKKRSRLSNGNSI